MKTKAGNFAMVKYDASGRMYMIDEAGTLYYDTGEPSMGVYIVSPRTPETGPIACQSGDCDVGDPHAQGERTRKVDLMETSHPIMVGNVHEAFGSSCQAFVACKAGPWTIIHEYGILPGCANVMCTCHQLPLCEACI